MRKAPDKKKAGSKPTFSLCHGLYIAVVTFDQEAGVYRGKVVNLKRDHIDFVAKTVGELPRQFKDSVEEYEDLCRTHGEQPESPDDRCVDALIREE